MSSMFSQMLEIANSVSGTTTNKNCSAASHYLSKNESDFFEKDKEVVSRETHQSDVFIWGINGSGSGTILINTSDPSAEARVCAAHEKTLFYVLRFTGPNEGSISEASQEAALEAIKEEAHKDHLQCERRPILQIISEASGLSERDLKQISLFYEDLDPEPNEPIFIKLCYDKKMKKVLIDMAKPNLSNQRTANGPRRKHGLYSFAPTNPDQCARNLDSEKYLRIKPCDNAFLARTKDVTKFAFEAADKKAKTKKAKQKHSCTVSI